MKNIITTIILALFLTSCVKEKKKEAKTSENKPSIFLSFTFDMNDEDFQKALEFENSKNSLLNDKFILEILDEKLYFEISRNRGSIELSDYLSRKIEPIKYVNELLRIFKDKYNNIQPLKLPIHSFFNENTNVYFYNYEDTSETFRGKKTRELKNYGFEQNVYYKAESSDSDIVALIGYSTKKSMRGIGELQEPAKSNFKDSWKDIAITINYFSREGYNSLIEKIDSDYNEFQEFKKNELNKENEDEKFRDSISETNLNKI